MLWINLPSSTVESSCVTLMASRSILAWRLELLDAIDSASQNRFPKISSAWRDSDDSCRMMLAKVPFVTPSSSSGTWNVKFGWNCCSSIVNYWNVKFGWNCCSSNCLNYWNVKFLLKLLFFNCKLLIKLLKQFWFNCCFQLFWLLKRFKTVLWNYCCTIVLITVKTVLLKLSFVTSFSIAKQ